MTLYNRKWEKKKNNTDNITETWEIKFLRFNYCHNGKKSKSGLVTDIHFLSTNRSIKAWFAAIIWV